MKKTLCLLALSLILLLGMTPAARPDIITPAGLNPGDQFRIVFVSSATRDATSSNIAVYDLFITNLAVAAGLGTYQGGPVSWFAIGSTPTVNANDPGRLPTTSNVPIFRVDEVPVATGGADLWDGAIMAPINVTEAGALNNTAVWTGTLSNGFSTSSQQLGSGGGFTVVGVSSTSIAIWVNFTNNASGLSHSLYGYSGVLTVAQQPAVIPEPTSLTLVLVGIAGLAGYRWRRQRAGQVKT